MRSKATAPIPWLTAIHQFVGNVDTNLLLTGVEEIPGHGLKAIVDGKELLVGNFKLLDKHGVTYDTDPASIVYTLIAVAYGGRYVGYLTIADSIKPDAKRTIDHLKALGVNVTMLSGDKGTVVKYVAETLGIAHAYGDLLPEDKVAKVKELKARHQTVAFVGDGVNDVPVVALSDVGIAMGGLGSDATIETADVVIQDDMPSKIPLAIAIGKQTKRIVWQNIILAFSVKVIVLTLGAGGIATMWEAVFADVGVALLAILNAVCIQRMNFKE
ncbi:MAG: HAD-IC family P-type ATPase [Paludibacteraceae bacterium]